MAQVGLILIGNASCCITGAHSSRLREAVADLALYLANGVVDWKSSDGQQIDSTGQMSWSVLHRGW